MSDMPALAAVDPKIHALILQETRRQDEFIRLIPSENYASQAVMEATGSVLANKYSEGYPGRRYYEGQDYIDLIETIAIDRAKALFGVKHANVQPYSGSPANQAVYLAPGFTSAIARSMYSRVILYASFCAWLAEPTAKVR